MVVEKEEGGYSTFLFTHNRLSDRILLDYLYTDAHLHIKHKSSTSLTPGDPYVLGATSSPSRIIIILMDICEPGESEGNSWQQFPLIMHHTPSGPWGENKYTVATWMKWTTLWSLIVSMLRRFALELFWERKLNIFAALVGHDMAHCHVPCHCSVSVCYNTINLMRMSTSNHWPFQMTTIMVTSWTWEYQ